MCFIEVFFDLSINWLFKLYWWTRIVDFDFSSRYLEPVSTEKYFGSWHRVSLAVYFVCVII